MNATYVAESATEARAPGEEIENLFTENVSQDYILQKLTGRVSFYQRQFYGAILTVRVVPFAETAHDHAMSMFSDREGEETGTALVEGQGQSGENKDAPGSCLGASFICGGSGRDHEFGQPVEMPGVGIDGRHCEAQGGATLKKPGQGDAHF